MSGAEPHEPTDACAAAHCYWHNVDEPLAPRFYRMCGECFHVFYTAEELTAAWETLRAEIPELGPAPPARDIASCPLCSHDW